MTIDATNAATQSMLDDYTIDAFTRADELELCKMSDAELIALAREQFKASDAKIDDDELSDADADELARLLALRIREQLIETIAHDAIADATNDETMLRFDIDDLKSSSDELANADADELELLALRSSSYRYVYNQSDERTRIDDSRERLFVRSDDEREQVNKLIDKLLHLDDDSSSRRLVLTMSEFASDERIRRAYVVKTSANAKQYLTIRNNELAFTSKQSQASVFRSFDDAERFLKIASVDSRNARIAAKCRCVTSIEKR